MASKTTTARAVIFSRITALSAKYRPPSSLALLLPNRRNRPLSAVIVNCLNSGGVYDDYFVSTQKSHLDRGLLVISNMLKNIEPLDNSVVSKGVSDSTNESMTGTISTMLGILPSDLFSVSVSISKPPLHRLLFSSISTGYTLWNAEYRVSLTRNLERAAPVEDMAEETEGAVSRRQGELFVEKREEGASQSDGFQESEKIRPRIFGDLSPEALNYTEKLQAELSEAEEELNAQKKENVQIECERENRNDLLEYLRSLDGNMVTELSRPSSRLGEQIASKLCCRIIIE
ncbi:putative F-box protein [Hibiscus syriacus]|uniref:F-box protein n=1 Tax=Hibiscus syriacus TaxID=106335 RepID=A0A6A3C808_HIBSY|nr:putative F-box protein [Hibiscus syriacus]